jgi:hypothetical protein
VTAVTPPTNDEIAEAFRVLSRALALSDSPVLLAEFGVAFEDKFIFSSLDWIRTSAGAMGFDTRNMRDSDEQVSA